MKIKKRCLSRKEYGEDRTNVGYALYVRDNIKENDYFRDITGGIHKMMYINGNKIYYVYGDAENPYWVDISAVNNFQENLIDLIEVGDIVESEVPCSMETTGILHIITDIDDREMINKLKRNKDMKILSILTYEQYNTNCYRVDKSI